MGGALRVKLKNTKLSEDKPFASHTYGWTGITLNTLATGQVAEFEKIALTDDGKKGSGYRNGDGGGATYLVQE